jgi:hypothetical protein
MEYEGSYPEKNKVMDSHDLPIYLNKYALKPQPQQSYNTSSRPWWSFFIWSIENAEFNIAECFFKN